MEETTQQGRPEDQEKNRSIEELKEVIERLKKVVYHSKEAAYNFAEEEEDDKRSNKWTVVGDKLEEALEKLKEIEIP